MGIHSASRRTHLKNVHCTAANITGLSPGCPEGSCLRSHINRTETEQAFSMITKAGVPSRKIMVGLPLYGRSFQMAQAGCYTEMCKVAISPGTGCVQLIVFSQANSPDPTAVQLKGSVRIRPVTSVTGRSSRFSKPLEMMLNSTSRQWPGIYSCTMVRNTYRT